MALGGSAALTDDTGIELRNEIAPRNGRRRSDGPEEGAENSS
jgi:hypothetical protein